MINRKLTDCFIVEVLLARVFVVEVIVEWCGDSGSCVIVWNLNLESSWVQFLLQNLVFKSIPAWLILLLNSLHPLVEMDALYRSWFWIPAQIRVTPSSIFQEVPVLLILYLLTVKATEGLRWVISIHCLLLAALIQRLSLIHPFQPGNLLFILLLNLLNLFYVFLLYWLNSLGNEWVWWKFFLLIWEHVFRVFLQRKVWSIRVLSWFMSLLK